ITDGRHEETLKAGPDAAYMAFGAIFHEELMLGLRTIKSGTLDWRLVSLSGSLPVNWSAEVELVGEPTGQPKIARLSTSLGEVITVENRRIKAIDIADGEQTIRPTSDPWPSWQLAAPRSLEYAPDPDATFTRREIVLAGRPGEPALAAEILLPKKSSRKPRPAALFLSGTGRQDRYGFAGPPPVDLGAHAITDALAEAGFVVLRFDERGQGASEEGPRSWDLQLEDARRALRTLLVQKEVDPDRVVLIGHGEGGWRALQLDAEDREIAAIALLATPGRPYRVLLDEQAEVDILALPPELRDRAREQHSRMMAALESGQDLPPELASEADWARGLLNIDPEKLIRRGHAPLFVAQGDRDFEVDPNRDPKALQHLARKHKRPLSLHRYPGLDHLFKLETKTSSPTRYFDPDGPREVDTGMLQDLTEWLVQVTSPTTKTTRTR
ncbi:MAG TPA: alpha/beta hydrolase, partial [Nannocystis exedens]|nr:alpha/beta hydrolase [Nannocystis exedens]